MAHGLFTIKDNNWLKNQRIAGKILNEALSLIKQNIQPGISTNELNSIGHNHIIKSNAVPTFLNYKGFPKSFCISLNKTIVHGIPDDYKLQEGDVIKVDGGVTYNKAIADAAYTTICGKTNDIKLKFMVDDCRKILYNAIKFIKPGITTVGDIGFFINKQSNKLGYTVVKNLTGHGLEEGTPHADPIIYNEGEKGTGPVIVNGMTFCLEPMIVCSKNGSITMDSDGWAVHTKTIGAHFETTLFVNDNVVEDILQCNQ